MDSIWLVAFPALLYIHSTMWLLPACWSLPPLPAKVGLVFPHLLVWALFQASQKPPSEGQHHILGSSDKVLGPRSGFPGGAVVRNLPANAGARGDVRSIPGLGRSLGVGNGNPLQYSCLENPMIRGAWQAIVHEVAKSWTRLSDFLYCKCSLSLDNSELISIWKGNTCSWCQGQHCCCCLVAQSCPTLLDPMDCSPPGSSVHGISQARILEWVAFSFSTG